MRFSRLEELLEYAKLAGEDDADTKEAIVMAYLSGDEKMLAELQQILLAKAAPYIAEQDPFHPYPKEEVFHGDLEVGITKDAIWRIESEELCRHLFCGGITGAGKTTSAFFLMQSLHDLGKKFLSFGIKQDVRHLIRKQIPILILRCSGNANFNLSDLFRAPEGVDEVDYQTSFIKCFAQSTFIAEAGESLLLEAMTSVRAKEGYVDLMNLVATLKKIKCWSARMNDWKSTLLNRFGAFSIMFDKMFTMSATQQTFPIEKVIEKFNVEVELDGAGMFKSFFAALFALRIFKYRIANNMRSKRLLTAVFCDEVNILASKTIERHAATLGNPPVLLEYMPLSREFGIGYMNYSNQPSEVSNVLKAQAGVKMAMRLGDWTDILDMGNSMTLNKDQMQVIVDLPPGSAIVKMQGISPFPVVLPNYEIVKDVTDEEVNDNNQRLLQGTEWEKFLISNNNVNSVATPTIISAGISQPSDLDDIERAFLFDIYNRPLVGLTDRYKTLGFSIRQGNFLVESLRDDKKVIIEHEINLSGRGSSTKFLELTDSGHKMIGVNPKTHIGKGSGFLHELVQIRVAETLRNMPEFKEISIEGIINGKSIDILTEMVDGSKIAVEIAMSSVNEFNNAQKDLQANCDYVIIVTKDRIIMEEVEKLIENLTADERSKALVCIVYQILKCKTFAEVLSLRK